MRIIDSDDHQVNDGNRQSDVRKFDEWKISGD
jgi:hypothetical protein